MCIEKCERMFRGAVNEEWWKTGGQGGNKTTRMREGLEYMA